MGHGAHDRAARPQVTVTPMENEAEARRAMDWLLEIINGA